MKKEFIFSIAASALFTSNVFASGGTWGYTGHTGPEHWGAISEQFKTCGTGVNQSPINIQDSVEADMAPIQFNYVSNTQAILNNGHTIQVNVAPGSSIQLDHTTFELKQFHFHTPSENQINNQSFPLEAHFVHADSNGNLAVVGVMFNPGQANPQITQLWEKMPAKAGTTIPLDWSAKQIQALLPKGTEYYRFNGSLTTPPCTEGVRWVVMQEPMPIASTQVERFAKIVHTNSRPVQKLHARVILK